MVYLEPKRRRTEDGIVVGPALEFCQRELRFFHEHRVAILAAVSTQPFSAPRPG
jgi:hypothetical protein